MATYRYVAKDIQTSMKKAFDDADVRLTQILYWVQVIANRLRYEGYLETESGLYLSTFTEVTILTDTKGRQYFDLPSQIMDLPFEKGIKYITYNYDTGCCCTGANFAQVYFQPTNVSSVHRLYLDEYEKPTTSNPYFYRLGDKYNGVAVNRVYLVGTECIDVKDVEIGLLLSLDPAAVCSLDDVIPLPDEKIEGLMKEVLQLGRFVMMMPEERVNQGADESSAEGEQMANIPEAPQVPQNPENYQQ
tara:strand:- start:17343 stop:18080 length:738 start_codon:yes stop_codon:yes gene_type:complete